MSSGGAVLCQACGTLNAADLETCRRCGLRLMILSAVPTEDDAEIPDEAVIEADDDFEENILERLTSLEDGLRHLSEALAATAEHLTQLERNLTVTHSGIQTLTSLLESRGLVSRVELISDWERSVDQELRSREFSRRSINRSRRILSQAAHTGRDTPQFRSKLENVERILAAPDRTLGLEPLVELTELAPDNDELWSLVGETAFESGQLEIAREAFQRVLSLRGPHLETLIYLGTVASDLELWDEAEATLQAAHRMAPELFLPSFSLGALASEVNQPRKAIRHLEAAVECEEVPQAHYLLGINHLLLGHPGRAITALKRAIGLEPEFEEALYQLGVAYLRRGWTKKALATFQRVLRMDPDRLRYQESVRMFSLDEPQNLPESAQELADQAQTALDGGRQDHAFALFQKAVEAAPDHPELRATTALLATSTGRYRLAVSHAHEVLRQGPTDTPYLAAAVAAVLESLRHANKPHTARVLAERFFREGQNHLARGIAAYELALAAVEIGDHLDSATNLAREALEFTPKELLHFPLAALGTIAINRRRFREARKYLEQAAEIAPTPDLMRQLAIACLGAGDTEGAEAALATGSCTSNLDLRTDLITRLRDLSSLRDELMSR